MKGRNHGRFLLHLLSSGGSAIRCKASDGYLSLNAPLLQVLCEIACVT